MKQYILLLTTSFLIAAASAQAAFFPLEITNIKPAGTSSVAGEPAIPTTNRIFRAYPGIEYNIRAAVIGGVYPYTYSLSNAPLGMTINSKTGEISWTPSSTGVVGPITLSVTDSDSPSDTKSTTWSITVTDSTDDFIFIQSGYVGTENGSISQPYSSLANMLANETSTNKIVYFRAGVYQLVYHRAVNLNTLLLDQSPDSWLAYPGEAVVLQGGTASGQARTIRSNSDFYFDGFTINETRSWAIMSGAGSDYKTVRRCSFVGLEPLVDNYNDNYGFLYTGSGDNYYVTVQDNEFTQWVNSSAIGSLYYDVKMLIENNYIHSPRATSEYSGLNITLGISPKYGTDYLTVRGNKVIMNTGDLMGGVNAAFVGADNIEICFNLFYKTSGRGGHIFDNEVGDQLTTKYWRNTLIGDIGIRGQSGPYTITENVISNPNTTDGWNTWTGSVALSGFVGYSGLTDLSSYATISNNLTDVTASNLVDNNYKLVPAQSAYVGSRGWQFADGTTPIEGIQSAPPPGQARRLSLAGSLIKLAEPEP